MLFIWSLQAFYISVINGATLKCGLGNSSNQKCNVVMGSCVVGSGCSIWMEEDDESL